MAQGTPLAAIDVSIGYLTASSKPNSVSWAASGGFTRINDLKSSGDFNPAPNTADATTFDNKTYTTYVDLLKDLGGAIEFSANLTQEFLTGWEACVTAYNALTTGTHMYFAIDIKGLNKSIIFEGKPSELGMPAMTANSLIETTVYITPLGEPTWVADSNG